MSTTAFIENRKLHNREGVFGDREDAGRALAELLGRHLGPNSIILAVPSGGVPIGRIVADELALDFDLCIVRKAQLPWNTETGFGAVNLDGEVILNKAAVGSMRLSQEAMDEQVERTRAILKRRDELFRKGRPFPDLTRRTAVLVDDGLASGFTMLAAVAFVKRRNPAGITIAVPTGCLDTVRRLENAVDGIVCLNVRDFYPFAVATAYRNWHDLSDGEVLEIIEGTVKPGSRPVE